MKPQQLDLSAALPPTGRPGWGRLLFPSLVLLLPAFAALAQPAVPSTTSFAGIANGTAYAANQPSPATATIGSTGWTFTGVANENVNITSVAGTTVSVAGAQGTNDPFIRSGRTTTSGDFTEVRVRPNGSLAFKLNSVALNDATSPSGPATLTLTGYRAGAAVSGATLAQSGTASFTWLTFNTSANTAFQNIDEFRVTLTGVNVGTLRATLGVDEINIAAAVVPAATATVTTTTPASITTTGATLGGNVTADGGATITERGVVYVAGSGTPTTASTKLLATGTTGSYTASATGLTAATLYTVRAYAINSAGTSYGSSQTFTTTPNAPTVTAPANNAFVNTATPTYMGTAQAGATVTVYVDGTSIGTTTATGGNFSLNQPTALAQGSHTVYATATVGASAASANSTTNTFTVDTVAPTVVLTSTAGSSGGSTSTSPIPYTATFSESVTGFVMADITVTGGTVTGGSLSGSGSSYSFTVTPSGAGTVSVSIIANGAQDAAGNGNTAAAPHTLTYAPAPVNLTISTGSTAVPVSIAAGTYNTITVTGTGYAILGGAVSVSTDLTVQNGGSLSTNCQPLTGAGSFALAAGATLSVCDPNGLNASGPTGAVQVTGPRTYSTDALYAYVGSAAQATGAGLPATVRSLSLANAAGLALTQNLTVTTALAVTTGVLTTGSARVTLGSAAALSETETAYVVGLVATTRPLAPGTAEAFGGLGLTLTPAAGSASPGSTLVVRSTGTALTGAGSNAGVLRNFDIQPAVNAGLNVALAFGYFAHELNGIAPANLALFWSETGAAGPWANQRPVTLNAGAGTVSKAGVASFSIWTLGNAAAPLPVALLTFAAERQSEAARLTWATASEQNSAYFEAEASPDGTVFRTVGRVAAQGNSAQPRAYQLRDPNLLGYGAALVYYRLRQVDEDGTASYSPVRAVRAGDGPAPGALAVFPNPAHGRVQWVGPADAPVQLLDLVGRCVRTAPAGASTLDLTGVPAGVYRLRSVRLAVE